MLFEILGYTEANPDFRFRAALPTDEMGAPSFEDVCLAMSAAPCYAATLYAQLAKDGLDGADRREDLETPDDAAIYLFHGMACEACMETDRVEDGPGVEFSCGEDDCHPGPFMVVTRAIDETK